jgi:peroxiredoxin
MPDTRPPELESRPQSRREWTGWLGSLVLPLAMLVAIIGLLLYFETRGGGSTDGNGYGTVQLPAERNATGQPPQASLGRAAPDFVLAGPDGKTVRLSDLQGRPVVINFWATWCDSCRADLVALANAVDAHPDGALKVLAVNQQDAGDQADAFAQDYSLPFTVLLDSSGEVSRTWRLDGPTGGLPSTYFIDSRGVVRQVTAGPLTDASLKQGLSLIEGGN